MKNLEAVRKVYKSMSYIMLARISCRNPGRFTHSLQTVHLALEVLASPFANPELTDNHNLSNRARGIRATLGIIITLVIFASGKVPVVDVRRDHVKG